MKKRNPQPGIARSKRPSPESPALSKTVDLADIRRQITELVGNGALGMVETTIGEVGKGHYLGMKYLFEMIGLYPVPPAEDAPAQDSLAAILLQRLGVPDATTAEERVTKDSGTITPASEDGLE